MDKHTEMANGMIDLGVRGDTLLDPHVSHRGQRQPNPIGCCDYQPVALVGRCTLRQEIIGRLLHGEEMNGEEENDTTDKAGGVVLCRVQRRDI